MIEEVFDRLERYEKVDIGETERGDVAAHKLDLVAVELRPRPRDDGLIVVDAVDLGDVGVLGEQVRAVADAARTVRGAAVRELPYDRVSFDVAADEDVTLDRLRLSPRDRDSFDDRFAGKCDATRVRRVLGHAGNDSMGAST